MQWNGLKYGNTRSVNLSYYTCMIRISSAQMKAVQYCNRVLVFKMKFHSPYLNCPVYFPAEQFCRHLSNIDQVAESLNQPKLLCNRKSTPATHVLYQNSNSHLNICKANSQIHEVSFILPQDSPQIVHKAKIVDIRYLADVADTFPPEIIFAPRVFSAWVNWRGSILRLHSIPRLPSIWDENERLICFHRPADSLFWRCRSVDLSLATHIHQPIVHIVSPISPFGTLVGCHARPDKIDMVNQKA